MNRKTLIIVTILFLAIIGTLLFFTVLEMNQTDSESFKSNGITVSSVSIDKPVYSASTTTESDDYIKGCGCKN